MNKFDIDLDSVVLTSTYILVDKQPILHVIYEDDGSGISWQFHCGNGDYSMDKLRLVSFRDILALNATIEKLYDLPVNHEATRKSVQDKWQYSAL